MYRNYLIIKVIFFFRKSYYFSDFNDHLNLIHYFLCFISVSNDNMIQYYCLVVHFFGFSEQSNRNNSWIQAFVNDELGKLALGEDGY